MFGDISVTQIPLISKNRLTFDLLWDGCDVVYVGMAGGEVKSGIGGRLRSHKRKKGKAWTHFSAFEVWDNIREDEVRELEGIFRHIYRKDSRAGKLNKQKAFNKLRHVCSATEEEGWLQIVKMKNVIR